MTSTSGRFIGKYRILSLLGSGSMGRVYKVEVPILKKIAALKFFKPSKMAIKKAGDDWLREQFIHEAAVIANIRHPNIAQIWSLETSGSDMFYLMEYFCRNLGGLIGEGYWADSMTRLIPMEKACQYGIELLDGLSRLHDAGIVHRDIKPFNLMVTDMGTIKIIDFGLSKRRGEKHALPENQLEIGTPFYSAPEQIKNPEKADARADLYSAAVVLYRMLTGHLPSKDRVLPGQLNPLMDHLWDAFFKKALDSDPGRRFQTAANMSARLSQLAADAKDRKQRECFPALEDTVLQKSQLRSLPKRILAKHATAFFKLDALKRPKTYLQNQFEEKTKDLIYDRATGLVWQVCGSTYPMQRKEALEYIKQLSATKTGGLFEWRLPTMDELLSLLHPPENENLCIDTVFSTVQTCLWSADTRSPRAAWTLDLEMGFVSSSDVFDYYFVKGVCRVD